MRLSLVYVCLNTARDEQMGIRAVQECLFVCLYLYVFVCACVFVCVYVCFFLEVVSLHYDMIKSHTCVTINVYVF